MDFGSDIRSLLKILWLSVTRTPFSITLMFGIENKEKDQSDSLLGRILWSFYRKIVSRIELLLFFLWLLAELVDYLQHGIRKQGVVPCLRNSLGIDHLGHVAQPMEYVESIERQFELAFEETL